MNPLFSYTRRIGDVSACGTPLYMLDVTIGRHCYVKQVRRHVGGWMIVLPGFTFSFNRIL